MKVILYTAPGCPYCIIVKNFLKMNNVKFQEIDISKNDKKREKLIEKSGQMSVPVTDVDGKMIVGYDVKKLKEALGIK